MFLRVKTLNKSRMRLPQLYKVLQDTTTTDELILFAVNVNLNAELNLPRIEKSSQLNEIKLLFIEKNDIRWFKY